MPSLISNYISGITCADAIQEHKNLAILPLFSSLIPKTHYISVNEAIDKDQINIKEVDGGGSVPTLIAINKGSIPILLLQGEEVEGAKQNRVFNTTIMLKEHTRTMIPVSCTEAGRWSYMTAGSISFRERLLRDQLLRNNPWGTNWTCGSYMPRFDNNSTPDIRDLISLWDDADTGTEDSENEQPDTPLTDNSTTTADGFTRSYNIMPAFMRKTIIDSVSDNLESDNSYESDQSEVWNQVSVLSRKANVQSPTSALKDVFTEKHDTLSEYTDAFHCLPDQQGALVFLNGKVQSLDIFSKESAYEDYQEKLVKSYAMEAMVAKELTGQEPSRELGKAFIQKAACSNESRHSSVGIGQDYRLKSSDLVGSALVHKEEVIHMTILSESE